MDQVKENYEGVLCETFWGDFDLDPADASDETRSVSSYGSFKEEYMQGCYLRSHGSTCSSPYEDDPDFANAFDESPVAPGDNPYPSIFWELLNTNGESIAPQYNEPEVMGDPLLGCEVAEDAVRLELMNLICQKYQQPQNPFMDVVNPNVDSFGPATVPAPFFSMSSRQNTKQVEESNSLELFASILRSQKPFKDDNPYARIAEVEKCIKKEEPSSNEITTPSITKKKLGGSPAQQQKGVRKKRKYERRATARKSIQLYEFMLNLLDQKDDCVTWVSREEGVFKLLKSKGVAQMWGSYKKNDNMTYESLSRALRHYYAQEILVPVPKKLHYRFCKKTLDNWYKKKLTC